MADVKFYFKDSDGAPTEFRVSGDGDDRLATVADKDKYPNEYKEAKMERAKLPPRPENEPQQGDATITIKNPDGTVKG